MLFLCKLCSVSIIPIILLLFYSESHIPVPSYDSFAPPPLFFFRDNEFDYLEFRLWIGLWSAFFCLLLVATDASYLVQYFTRFTEEGFSCLISFIFIYDAFKKMIKLAHHYPINPDFRMEYVTQYDCLCMAPTVLGE